MPSTSELEEVCRQSFDSYLRSSGARQVAWRKGEDPPDYYVRVDGITYGVEATTVMEMVTVDSMQFPVASIHAAIHDFVGEVERQALLEGTLSGHYVIAVPRPLASFARFRSRLTERALDYIRRTTHEDSGSAGVLLHQAGGDWTIQKAIGSLCTVSTIGPITALGFEAGFKQEACRLLEMVITRKARKLAHLSVPSVLLVLNEYRIIESWHYQECVPGLASLEDFHTIFIVDDEAAGYVLSSKGAGWQSGEAEVSP